MELSDEEELLDEGKVQSSEEFDFGRLEKICDKIFEELVSEVGRELVSEVRRELAVARKAEARKPWPWCRCGHGRGFPPYRPGGGSKCKCHPSDKGGVGHTSKVGKKGKKKNK
jgi:hypothetical protein